MKIIRLECEAQINLFSHKNSIDDFKDMINLSYTCMVFHNPFSVSKEENRTKWGLEHKVNKNYANKTRIILYLRNSNIFS